MRRKASRWPSEEMPDCSFLPHPTKPAHMWLHRLWGYGDARGVSPPYRPVACVDLVCKSPNVPSTWLGVTGLSVPIPQPGWHCSALQSAHSPCLLQLPRPSQDNSSWASVPMSCPCPPPCAEMLGFHQDNRDAPRNLPPIQGATASLLGTIATRQLMNN